MPIMPAVRLSQGPYTLYVGSLEAGELISTMVVDRWDPQEGWNLDQQGYQREIYEDHIDKIISFLTGHPNEMLPTSIVATIREDESPLTSYSGDDIGHLTIQPGCHLYIIDGQHRLIAIDRALQKDPSSALARLRLPLVLLANVDKVDELRQFHLINDRQRRIATNLALALLATAAASDPRVAQTLTQPGEEWRLPATGIAIRLNEDPGSPWTGRVRYPSSSVPLGSTAVTPLNSLVRSLEQFLKNRDDIQFSSDELTDYLKRFWQAVMELMPDVQSRPGDYVLQRTTGVYSLNFVAYELWRQRPSVRTATVEEIQHQLSTAQDYLVADKWRRRAEFATNYRGNSRFRELGREILEKLGLDARRRRRTNS